MNDSDAPLVQPLPYKTRKRTFSFLFFLFIVSLPFLFLYAAGYRFTPGDTQKIVSTGGIYVAADRAGASIYIDGTLVRETRIFRTAFYAQNINPGTHRVHVEKKGNHTWVKELPVYPHLVTEAEAFNLPLVPTVRVIAPYQNKEGAMIVAGSLLLASTTNDFIATTTTGKTTYVKNTEFATHLDSFITQYNMATSTLATSSKPIAHSTSTNGEVTDETKGDNSSTTKIQNNTRLYDKDGEIYAQWIGGNDQAPYYYCAPEFSPYEVKDTDARSVKKTQGATVIDQGGELTKIEPAKSVVKTPTCEPVIQMDRHNQKVSHFDFYPTNSDLVILGLEDGIYVEEIDNRGWQNRQPLIMGKNLMFIIENGVIYVYDGEIIYQLIVQS